jgi:hypothetical protein
MEKPVEFVQEVIKRLKLNVQTQILVALSMLESIEDQEVYDPEATTVKYTDAYLAMVKYFRQKLIDFNANSKSDQLPEYAAHRILFLLDSIEVLQRDESLWDLKQNFILHLQSKFSQFTPLRSSLHQDASQINCNFEMPSFNILREGCGLEHLELV